LEMNLKFQSKVFLCAFSSFSLFGWDKFYLLFGRWTDSGFKRRIKLIFERNKMWIEIILSGKKLNNFHILQTDWMIFMFHQFSEHI
jgi:hypothetical protein